MSQITLILKDMQAQLNGVEYLSNKSVIAYNNDDLLDMLKGLKTYPGIGIVYEGMRSVPPTNPGQTTAKVGVSSEAVISLILVVQGESIIRSQESKFNAIDYLDMMRLIFLGQRNPITQQYWNFLVEAPAALASGMVFWVQRWSVPVQNKPVPKSLYA
jgi:hypothetical protein